MEIMARERVACSEAAVRWSAVPQTITLRIKSGDPAAGGSAIAMGGFAVWWTRCVWDRIDNRFGTTLNMQPLRFVRFNGCDLRLTACVPLSFGIWNLGGVGCL